MKAKKLVLALISVIFFTFLFSDSVLFSKVEAQDKEVKKKEEKKKETKKKATKKKVTKKKKEKLKSFHYEMTVTATRTKRDTFEVPKPITVIPRKKIEEKAANNITDLLVEEPGVDVSGVSANQSKPVIRGERGSRILLMEDGIRMNSARFDADLGGETTSLVDMQELDRVEVVRGPASVLYGSDAIGGVINLITRLPEYDINKSVFRGNLSYAYSSNSQNKGALNFFASTGRLGLRFSGNLRKVNDYTAPAGKFGQIELKNDVVLRDTGVKDYGINFHLNYKINQTSNVSFKYSKYDSEDGGFGSVDAAEYGGDTSFLMDIMYPVLKNDKYTLKYQNTNLGIFLADYLSFTSYYKTNERQVNNDMFMDFGFMGAYMKIDSLKTTNIDTTGFRLELNKAVKNHLFTYGVDYASEKSKSVYDATTEMKMFGPPSITEDTTSRMPNASYTTSGLFIQDDISLFNRASLILGVRYQHNSTESESTPSLPNIELLKFTDETVVGAANLVVGITDELKFVLSTGKGFRSPNLVDRFYAGMASGAIFVPNEELKAETSFNVDIGLKFRNRNFYLEGTYFNNTIKDGIAMISIEDNEQGLEQVQKVNIDKMRKQGVELLGKVYFNFGLSLSANYSKMESKDLSDPDEESVYASFYSNKINFNLRYEPTNKLFWVGYDLRIMGDQKDSLIEDNVIGSFIPGYTVHSVYAGINLLRNSRFPMRLGIHINNLTNELYAEFSNARMFRPAPARTIALTWSTSF